MECTPITRTSGALCDGTTTPCALLAEIKKKKKSKQHAQQSGGTMAVMIGTFWQRCSYDLGANRSVSSGAFCLPDSLANGHIRGRADRPNQTPE